MRYIIFDEAKRTLNELEDYGRLLTEYGSGAETRAAYNEIRTLLRDTHSRFARLAAALTESDAEPNAYDAITALSEGGNVRQPADRLLNRIKGALVGRFAGCTLGTPVENWDVEKMRQKAAYEGSAFPPEDYWQQIGDPWRTHYGETWHAAQKAFMNGVPRDDDVTYTLLSLLIMETYGKDFTTDDVGAYWKANLPMACTAEDAALQNLKKGIPAREAAMHDNPYANLIGALIRADGFGYANAGDPHAAAAAGYRDAYLSHRRNGIYGEMLFAAAIAAAFTCGDGVEAVRIGLREIPKTSALYREMQWAFAQLPAVTGIDTGRALADARFAGMNSVHTVNNACLILFALHLGQNDVGKTISAAVGLGLDNDCTAATAGSIAGAVSGFDSIEEKWYAPFHDTVRTYISGHPVFSIDDAARRFAALND